jgi:hypothetical protein
LLYKNEQRTDSYVNKGIRLSLHPDKHTGPFCLGERDRTLPTRYTASVQQIFRGGPVTGILCPDLSRADRRAHAASNRLRSGVQFLTVLDRACRRRRHETNAKFVEDGEQLDLRPAPKQRIFAVDGGERLDRKGATDRLDARPPRARNAGPCP